MDHGMGENSGSNGILMEEEIFHTASGTSPSQDIAPQGTQMPQGASLQHNTMTQSETLSQYETVTQTTLGAQPQQAQQMTQPQQVDELAAFNSAPSFDAMDGVDMYTSGANSNDAFAGNTNQASSGWQSQDSDMVFQGSAAGRAAGENQTIIYEKTSSNILLGLVGAVIGALIGAALWIGIYQLGYIAGLAGAAIIGFSIKGYIILGKSIDIKGIVLCALLSIVTIYFAHRVAFAITYMKAFNETFDTNMSFRMTYTNLDNFMKTMDIASKALGTGNNVTMAYWRDLVVGYGLSAVVGIPMAIKMIARS